MALGGGIAIKYLCRKQTNLAISIVSTSIFVTIFLGSLSMNSLNKMIGAKEGCLQAAQTAKERQMPLVYYSFSAAPNLDYYFRQNDMQITEIDSASLVNLQRGILFFKERRIKKDSTLRQKIVGKEYMKLGDNICYAIFEE